MGVKLDEDLGYINGESECKVCDEDAYHSVEALCHIDIVLDTFLFDVLIRLWVVFVFICVACLLIAL